MYTGIIIRKFLLESLRFTSLILVCLLVLGIPTMVLQRMMTYKIPSIYMLHLVMYILPECLQFILPVSLLLGAVFALGRMGADQEILALKSMGICPVKLIYPLLIISIPISYLCWCVNDISPLCREMGIRNVILNSADEIAYNMLKSGGEIINNMLFIKVESVDKNRLISPEIRYQTNSRSESFYIRAKEARIFSDKQKRELIIELSEGTFNSGETNGSFQNKENVRFPIDSILPSDDLESATNATSNKIKDFVKVMKKEIQKNKQTIAAEASIVYLTGNYDDFNNEIFNFNQQKLQANTENLQKTLIEPYRRFTLGFACLCLLIVGTPLTICNHKMDIIANIFLSAGPTIAVFALFFSMGLNLGKQGIVPPSAICLTDIFLLITGLFFMRKAAN